MKRLRFPCFRSIVRCRLGLSDTVATRNTTRNARDDSATAVHDLRCVSSSFQVVVPLSLLLFFFFSFVFAIFYTLPPHSPFTVPFTTTTGTRHRKEYYQSTACRTGIPSSSTLTSRTRTYCYCCYDIRAIVVIIILYIFYKKKKKNISLLSLLLLLLPTHKPQLSDRSRVVVFRRTIT